MSRIRRFILNLLLLPVFPGLLIPEEGDGEQTPPGDSSVSTLQKEIRTLGQTIGTHVKALRDEFETLRSEQGGLDQRINEIKSETLGNLEETIKSLREKQETLQRRYAEPRLLPEEAREMLLVKKNEAFVRALRSAWKVPTAEEERVTAEDLALLYPDGRRVCNPTDSGSQRAILAPKQARALVEDATGQILVPEDLYTEIQRTVEAISVIRPRAQIVTTTSNRERYRSMTEATMTYGQSPETGGSIVKSTPTPSEAHQYIENLIGWVEIGEDELEDADILLVQFIVSSLARAKRETEDTKYITGSGHSSYEPDGITNGSTVARVIAANAASITFEDLLDLMYGNESGGAVLSSQYRNNGTFIAHSWTELALMKIRSDGGGGAGTGPFVWNPAIAPGMANTLYGKTIVTQDDIDQISTGNDTMIFGDLRAGYRILDRIGLSIKRLDEIKIESGLIVFRSRCRNTGGVVNAAALRILQQA
jgi:HK97 family phage major capsid protein